VRNFLYLPEEYRILRTSPEEGSQALKSTNYSPENIKLIYIRGNWMLVRALDYAKQDSFIGWIRWRSDDGTIFAFPYLK